MDMTVANTILEQLGGRRFVAITGAKNFNGDANSLSFRLPARFAAKGINIVRVELTPMDVYTVTFFKLGRGLKMSTVATAENIYADNLQSTFTDETGLAVRL